LALRLREFAEQEVQPVWEKGRRIQNQDANKWRQDACGAWIGRDFYGKRESPYGWEIDHIDPNGGDSLSNLQPLQWKNNVNKSDGSLDCAVRASGTENVPAE
jgi:hypothetical protein